MAHIWHGWSPMAARNVGFLSVLFLASATFLGACAAPAEDTEADESEGAATMIGGKRYAEHTFTLGEASTFDFKVTAGRLRVIASADDPFEGDVVSVLKTGTVLDLGTITLSKVDDSGDAKVIATSKITVRVDSYLLQMVTPEADTFDRFMLMSGTYRLSTSKLPATGTRGLRRIDLAVTASW